MTHNPYHPAGGAGAVSAHEAAQTAYRICAETRHVTLGIKARDAILALSPTPPVPNPEAADDVIGCLLAEKPFWFDPATNFVHADDGGAQGMRWAPNPEAEGEAPVLWQWRSRLKGGAWDAWERGRFNQEVPPFAEVEERALYTRPSSEAEIADLRARLHDEQQDAHAGRLIIADLRAKLDRMRQALRLCVERDPGLYIHPVVRAALFLAGEETGASDV